MKETFRIGSRVQPTDPYWVLVRENMRQRVQEMGVFLVNVNLPLESVTGEAQLSLLDDLLAQELDALITHRLPEDLGASTCRRRPASHLYRRDGLYGAAA